MAKRKKDPSTSAGFVPLTEQEARDLDAFLATIDEPFRRDLRAMLDEHARWTQADVDYGGFHASVEAKHADLMERMRTMKQYDPLARLVVDAEQREAVAVRGALSIGFCFGYLAALGTRLSKPAALERLRGMLERHMTISTARPTSAPDQQSGPILRVHSARSRTRRSSTHGEGEPQTRDA